MNVAVVTGGSAGVGRATARAFADRGVAVGVIARGRERLEATVVELRERGTRQLDVPVDPWREDNLFDPAPGDWAARGIFGDARSSSVQLWSAPHRRLVAAGAAAFAGTLVAFFRHAAR